RGRDLRRPAAGGRASIEKACLALGAPARKPLARGPLRDPRGLGRPRGRPSLPLDPLDEKPAAVRAGAGVTVKLHPVSSLGLGWFDAPSLQGGPDEQRGEEL